MKTVTTADPEFSALVPSKPKSTSEGHSARLVRRIIYAQLVAALLTASHEIAYVASVHGLIGPEYRIQLENVSALASFTAFLFPLLMAGAVTSPGVERREGLRAILATIALFMFQVYAMLPLVS